MTESENSHMGFQYKLEALRQYRQFLEDRLQKELSDAVRSLEAVRSILAHQIARRRRCQEEFERHLESGAAASQTAMYPGYLKRLGDEIAARYCEVSAQEKVCDQIRLTLVEEMKKRRMLDRLKEKGEQAFMAELDTREQKFIGEMAINRFVHKPALKE
jgi:flagellar protein FliJ